MSFDAFRETGTNPSGPILRWAGSKRNQVALLSRLAPTGYGTYIEPFAGSMCLCLELVPNKAIIADFNKDLIQFYETIRSKPISVHKKLTSWERTPEAYLAVRSLRVRPTAVVTRAARFLYLNRNSFNAVYRTNQRGEFNVPYGSKTGAYPSLDTLLEFSNKVQHYRFCHADFRCTCRLAKENDFVYLDPPYTTSARKTTGEYGVGSFGNQDKEALIDTINALDSKGALVLLSYCADEAILSSLSTRWQLLHYSARRHVAGFAKHRVDVTDVAITNYGGR